MEDVLDLYAEKADPKRPVVCFDESASLSLRRRDNRNDTIANIAAAAPPTCSSSSMQTEAGAM
jgi:hypothetical protein